MRTQLQLFWTSRNAVAMAFLFFATTVVTMAPSARADIIKYNFVADIDEVKDKGVHSSDYGFGANTTVTGQFVIQDTQHDEEGHKDYRGKYSDGTLTLTFTVLNDNGSVLYTSAAGQTDDIELKLENNHNNEHDKLELKDKSSRSALNCSDCSSLAYEKFELKLEDNTQHALSSITPMVNRNMLASDWLHKNDIKIKWKSGGKDIELKGQLSSITVVPIPAAVWLFGSALIGLLTVARRRRI